MKIIKYDACKLSDLIEEVYKREYCVPAYMEDQRKIEVSITPQLILGTPDSDRPHDDKVLIENFVKGKELEPDDYWGRHQLFEALLSDLCIKKKLKAGNYLICFDD